MIEEERKARNKIYQRRYMEKHREQINARTRERYVEKMKTQDIWYSTEKKEDDTSIGFFRSMRMNYDEENYWKKN